VLCGRSQSPLTAKVFRDFVEYQQWLKTVLQSDEVKVILSQSVIIEIMQ
jgi:hypothetical protein